MSYIDTIPHIMPGTLAGYSIYAPLCTYKIKDQAWGHPEFQCHPRNLVLGGGSGEHPGLVVHHFDDLVRLYLLEAIEAQLSKNETFSQLEAFLLEGWTFDSQRCFEYCGWGAEDFATLVSRSQAEDLAYPYVKARDASFERWLALSLGSFCFHHLSCLMTPRFQEDLNAQIKNTGLVVDRQFFANLKFLPRYDI